ncbi:MAG: hypothetical protein AAGF97_19825 [Planctomycetota bacterium]
MVAARETSPEEVFRLAGGSGGDGAACGLGATGLGSGSVLVLENDTVPT